MPCACQRESYETSTNVSSEDIHSRITKVKNGHARSGWMKATYFISYGSRVHTYEDDGDRVTTRTGGRLVVLT